MGRLIIDAHALHSMEETALDALLAQIVEQQSSTSEARFLDR